MPIIPRVGRKSLRLRSLIIFVYGVLIAGSVTTVYPFLIMFATSLASQTDFEEYRLVPRYLYNDKALMTKYLEEKNKREQFDLFKLRYHIREPFEEKVSGRVIKRKYGRYIEMEPALRDYDLKSPEFLARVDDWHAFRKALPLKYKDTFFHAYIMPIGEADVAFQKYLEKKYPVLKDMQAAIEEQATSYIVVYIGFDAYDRHSWKPDNRKKTAEWLKCRETLPDRMMNVMTVRPIYEKYLYDKYGSIEALNKSWGASYHYFWQILFRSTRPAGKEGDDWETFLRKRIPMRYVRLDVKRCRKSYLEYLKDTYGTVAKYNGKTGDDASSLETVVLSEYMPTDSLKLFNWQGYYERKAPLDGIIIDTADVHFEHYLKDKYTNVAALNSAWGTKLASFEDAEPPWREDDYYDLTTRKKAIRWNYLTRNYVYVFKRVFLQGRPLINTFILVTLTVLSQITINPMAAYALSRYKLSYSSKVLIFMLATMAFPAEVTMIPNFLMIKRLHLLNTFGALILPRLANGYYVFLLKGFFDALPQELYEAASIDGANEFRMFRTITLPLSLPVLSVIALFAFGASYGSFLWALTTCQDQKMWTLMVFLQQFQQNTTSVPYILMASLVLAAIPTVIVFLSAQKVLMRGIVVPTMK